jgi:hypothetical protein
MRLRPALTLLCAIVLAMALPATPALADYSDVPPDHWAYDAVQYLAVDHSYMDDYGSDEFKPDTKELRKYLARTLVEIWAPDEPIDPTITFSDLPVDDEFYPYANVVVKLGWIGKAKDGGFNPDGKMKSRKFDRAVILALGLKDPMADLNAIQQADGTEYHTPKFFGAMQLARWLDLHYDHDDESEDIQKTTKVARDEAAWTIWQAATISQWRLDDADMFLDITLPDVDATIEAVTQYTIDELGPPYVWAGEWDKASPPGYCCGDQPVGGFDCSGWVWWVLKKDESNYDAAQFHPDYNGWHLAERVSSDMAEQTDDHLTYGQLDPGNLMFFASNGGNQADDVDHVGIYLGDGWMSHSTGGGPQIEWVGDGWWYDNFVWGRKLKTNASPQGAVDVTAGERPVGP